MHRNLSFCGRYSGCPKATQATKQARWILPQGQRKGRIHVESCNLMRKQKIFLFLYLVNSLLKKWEQLNIDLIHIFEYCTIKLSKQLRANSFVYMDLPLNRMKSTRTIIYPHKQLSIISIISVSVNNGNVFSLRIEESNTVNLLTRNREPRSQLVKVIVESKALPSQFHKAHLLQQLYHQLSCAILLYFPIHRPM